MADFPKVFRSRTAHYGLVPPLCMGVARNLEECVKMRGHLLKVSTIGHLAVGDPFPAGI